MWPDRFSPDGHAGRWWDDTVAVQRFVSDLIADEFGRLRPGALKPLSRALTPDARIDQDLGADSLELLSLGTALAETIHLHESGIEDYLLVRRSISEWAGIAAQGLDFFSARLTFRTSGSTGVPKPCTHALAALDEEIAQLAMLFRGRRRILTAVPCHHIYGFLFTILLPRALGIASDAVIDIRDSLPSSLVRRLQPGDLIVGHPDFWRGFTHGEPAIEHDIIGVTSSGPCPNEVSEAASNAGLAALYQIYGASETAGIGWRRSHQAPYSLFPYWSADASQADGLIRTYGDGRTEHLQAPDLLDWTGPGSFRVAARRDAAVQVGGTNVFPAQVREVLLRHPGVLDAAVRLMRPEEGTRLKAYIVAKPGSSDHAMLYRDLCAWVDIHLPPAARPKAFTVGLHLPVAATGKPCDWELNAVGAAISHPAAGRPSSAIPDPAVHTDPI